MEGRSRPDPVRGRVIARIWTEHTSSHRRAASPAQARRDALERIRNTHHTAGGRRLRNVARRPRCGLQLIRSLKQDSQAAEAEPAVGTANQDQDAEKPEYNGTQPGRVDEHFKPRETDLIVHHQKEVARPMLQFYDPALPLECGDYLVRYKHKSYEYLPYYFHAARVYMWHHREWVYLGKDSVQMPSTAD